MRNTLRKRSNKYEEGKAVQHLLKPEGFVL